MRLPLSPFKGTKGAVFVTVLGDVIADAVESELLFNVSLISLLTTTICQLLLNRERSKIEDSAAELGRTSVHRKSLCGFGMAALKQCSEFEKVKQCKRIEEIGPLLIFMK